MEEILILKSKELFEENLPFCIIKYSYDDFAAIKVHSHEFIEITYVCSGKGLHIINDRKYEVSKGDLYIINIETPHSFFPYDIKNTGRLTVFNCMFMPEFIENLNIELDLLKQIISLFLHKSVYKEDMTYTADLKIAGSFLREIETLYEKMHLEYILKQEGYVDILKINLCELLIKIYRAYISHNANLLKEKTNKYKLIFDSLNYLIDNCSNRLYLDEISQNSFLSKSYYSALFKKATGMSVIEYLQKVRIEKACQLLIHKPYKITQISEMIGYSDYRFFNKIFKKVTGMTAQEYRRKYT